MTYALEIEMATKKTTTAEPATVTITPPNMRHIAITIVGTAPYGQLKFSEKAKALMAEKMQAGTKSKKGAAKPPRDFDDDFRQAQHISEEGWNGIPASALRNAMIDACRFVGFRMTVGKGAIFVRADGIDRDDGVPLIKIKGKPEPNRMHVRNATGVADLRVRAMWREWGADLVLTFDGDQFTQSDVVNLIARAGMQVGIGEGRPFSKSSAGVGWGTFEIKGPK